MILQGKFFHLGERDLMSVGVHLRVGTALKRHPRLKRKPRKFFTLTGFSGAPERTRTSNLLIRSQMLYPLSYQRRACVKRGHGA